MKPRDRVLAALDYQETDIVPYQLPIEEQVAVRLDAHYGSPSWRERNLNHIARVSIPQLGVPEGPSTYGTDLFGSVWRTDGRPVYLTQPALSEPDLTGYTWPDLDQVWDEAKLRAQVEQARDRGQFVTASLGFGLFERSWTLRGLENAMIDMVLHPAFYEELMEGILAFQVRAVERLLGLPIDGIRFSDDWGDQRGVFMGPSLWRRFVKPSARRLNEIVHAASKWTLQHCCGNITDILPEVIEIGLDVLESLQPEAMDVYEVKRRFGRSLRLWGGLGTQQLLPFGTPQQIRDEVRRLCRELGRGGGYILGPAKPIMREVPTANAVAALEAFVNQEG